MSLGRCVIFLMDRIFAFVVVLIFTVRNFSNLNVVINLEKIKPLRKCPDILYSIFIFNRIVPYETWIYTIFLTAYSGHHHFHLCV